MENEQVITACAFVIKDDKALIAKRALTKKFLPGKYELPGGHIEFGETVEDGLRRELMEELQIDVEIEMPFYVFTYMTNGNTKHNVEIDYFAHLKDENQEVKINPNDHSEYKWISEDEVAKYYENGDNEGEALKSGFKILKKFK